MNSDPKAKLEFKRFEGYEIMILYPISMKQFSDQLFLGLKMGKLWQTDIVFGWNTNSTQIGI